MRKRILSVLLVASMVLSLAACGNNNSGNNGKADPTAPAATKAPDTKDPASTATPVPTAAADQWETLTDGQMVDGKFTTTRKITVEIFDRGNDGGSDPTNNMYTDYIKKGMLEDYNVEVEFVAVPRWTETENINNLLAAGDAPDICYTYSYPTINTYAQMGAVLNLGDMVNDYMPILPDLWNWLGDTNINYDRDPDTGDLWALEGKLANTNRIVTFVRQDWMDKLGIAEPKTTAEFEAMIYAFKENAETLLGADASKLIPFSASYDIGWRAALVIESFLDAEIDDKTYYINGFDDRKFTQEGTKEAVRLLNKWYNDGLMWNDFILYTTDSTLEDDYMKSGYVGAFQHNWDYPYRNGEDSIQANLKRNVGEEASYVAIDCFTNADGNIVKFGSDSVDRKAFFPATNDEPLASLLYLNWISNPEHIQYLQIGDEGVTHEVTADGAIKIIAVQGAAIMNSGQNIDYTMTCNGLNLVDPEQTAKSLQFNYAGVDPELVVKASDVAKNGRIVPGHAVVGNVAAEEGVGESLKSQRDICFDNAVVAPVAEFDNVWNREFQAYLDMGGQAILDERAEKWQKYYGDNTSVK